MSDYEFRQGDPISDRSRSAAQTATALLTSLQANIEIRTDGSVAAKDGFTDDANRILDDLSQDELRDLVYSLLGMWVGTAYEAQRGGLLGLFGAPRSAEEMLQTAAIRYASAPSRETP